MSSPSSQARSRGQGQRQSRSSSHRTSRSPSSSRRTSRSPSPPRRRSRSRCQSQLRYRSRSHSPRVGRRSRSRGRQQSTHRRSLSRSVPQAHRPRSVPRLRQHQAPPAVSQANHLTDPPFRNGKAPIGQPKATEYDPHTTKMVLAACHHFEVLICTEDPYPSDTTQELWAKKTWTAACEAAGIHYRLTDRIVKIVSDISLRHTETALAIASIPRSWHVHRTVVATSAPPSVR